MSKIRYGLKLRTDNESSIPEADKLMEKGIFDYVELFCMPNHNTEDYPSNVEVIHAPHAIQGFNIADKSKRDFNLKCMEESLKLADKTKAKYIIVHAGNTNNGGDEETAKKFLNKINDYRIIIENKPIKLHTDGIVINYGSTGLGYDAKKLEDICSNKYGICLDFVHACKSALTTKSDYKEVVKEFMKLKPKVFHICDSTFNREEDEHVHLGKGCYDLSFFKECIENNESQIASLETPREKSLQQDIENLKYFKSL